jgi:uncharacterized protein (TIGR02118 family)
MPTKITALFENPADPDAFEAAWSAEIVTLAQALPGVRRIEISKVWPKEDGTATPAYRTLDMYFDDYGSASAAVTTPAAGALFPVLAQLGSAGVRFVFFDVELDVAL